MLFVLSDILQKMTKYCGFLCRQKSVRIFLIDPEGVDVAIGDVLLVRDGLAVGAKAEAEATKMLKEKNIAVRIDLKDGVGCEEIYTCDFSLDYVKINADYRS